MNRTVRALCGFTLLVAPAIAFAHSPFKGIGDFYGGLLHPVFVPAHALLLGALGLFLGQQEPEENLIPLLLFLACAITGLAIAGNSDSGGFEGMQLLGAAAIGLLVAIGPRIAVFLRGLGGAFAGLLIGLDSGQADLAGVQLMAALIGTGVGMCVLLLCMMSLAGYCQARRWQQIGIRIISSWIAASAVLVLSLYWRVNAGN